MAFVFISSQKRKALEDLEKRNEVYQKKWREEIIEILSTQEVNEKGSSTKKILRRCGQIRHIEKNSQLKIKKWVFYLGDEGKKFVLEKRGESYSLKESII